MRELIDNYFSLINNIEFKSIICRTTVLNIRKKKFGIYSHLTLMRMTPLICEKKMLANSKKLMKFL